MAALGCMVPFVLMIIGAFVGAAIGGNHAGGIGLVVGLGLGVLAAGGMFWGLARLERR